MLFNKLPDSCTSHVHAHTGFVRHAMGVEFEGETHQDNKIYIVDAHIKGMPEEKVCHIIIAPFFLLT